MLITIAAYIFSIPLILLHVIVLQFDDALSPEARQLYESLEPGGTSEAYLYLLGILAAESDDPVEVGRDLLAEYRKLEDDESYQVRQYDDPGKLQFPDGDAFCPVSEEGCIQSLFDDLDLSGVLKAHSTLVARVDHFHAFKEYKTLAKPLLAEPFPPFRAVSTVERIKVLQAIEAHRSGFSNVAVSMLEGRIPVLRNGLALQDTLVGKMVYLNLLSQTLDVLSIISIEAGVSTREIDPLRAEMDLEAVAAREFHLGFNVLQQLDRHPELFKMGGYTPGWYARMFYKPNMTINSGAPRYSRLASDSLLSPAQFAQRVEQAEDLDTPRLNIRNPIGAVLANVYSSYDEYVARFMDFQAKAVLFNHLEEGFEGARNPYYEGEAPEILEDRVCFRAPLEDHRSLRCLLTSALTE